jgi:hypothetical protein
MVPSEGHPGKLWSLWDMLGQFGQEYYLIGSRMTELEEYLRSKEAGGGEIDVEDPRLAGAINFFADKKQFWAEQELKIIWDKIFKIGRRIAKHRRQKWRGTTFNAAHLRSELAAIKQDLYSVSSRKKFYYLRSDVVGLYGQQELFGPLISKRFQDAAEDIEHAGNCLALGEYTGAVFHLMRAMESAVRALAKKLKVTINPKDTWGMILNNMDAGIKALPEKTAQQKRKKDEWSECRVNLFHVKNAWRDNSMHGKRTYTDQEARRVMESVKVFMEQLASL